MIALWVVSIIGLLWFGFVFLYFAVFSQVPPSPESVIARNAHEVVATPEELGLRGTLLIDENEGVSMIDVLTSKRTPVLELTGDERVFGVAGPNANGVAIVIVNDMMAARHRLVRLDLANVTWRNVFERKGDALWGDAIGALPALAENANVALIFCGRGNLQLEDPPAYMSQGEIQRVDLDTGAVSALTTHGLDGVLALSSTGERAWYVSPVKRADAQALPGGESVAPSNGPASVVVEWFEGAERPIVSGWGARLAEGGKTLIIHGNGTPSMFYSFATRGLDARALPRHVYGTRWISEAGIHIAYAKQTRVEDVEFTRNNGLPGPRPMSRIVGFDPQTSRFATLVPAIDPRTEWSFGEWSTGSEELDP